MLRRYVARGLAVLFVVVVLALLVGQALGQPVLLSFVTTDSMSPTIAPGDGFLVAPDQLSGEIQEGDVIVFDAQELQGGGLTTHRVVEVTEEGYITQGDNNAFTDQDGDEPPVTDDQVVASAVQVGGDVVTLPGLGTAILWFRDSVLGLQEAVVSVVGFEGTDNVQDSGIVLVLAGAALLLVTALDSLRGTAGRDRGRSTGRKAEFDPRFVVVFLLLVVLVPANAAMLGPSETHQVQVEGAGAGEEIAPGDPASTELTATNSGLVAMLVLLDAPGEDTALTNTQLSVPGGQSQDALVTAPAPPPGEERTVTVTEQRYLVVLPESLLAQLHAVSPWLAIGAINAVLGFGILAFAGGLVGLRRRRVRETGRSVPLSVRLRRLFR